MRAALRFSATRQQQPADWPTGADGVGMQLHREFRAAAHVRRHEHLEISWRVHAGRLSSPLVRRHSDNPSGFLHYMPDGRMLIAEREGRLRIVRGGRLLQTPAWSMPPRHSDQEQLLAVAVDPDFDRSHLVHVIYTTTSARGELVFCLARLREVADTFGDQIVLFDDVPASPTRASASLRFGPDSKLFAAFDDGGMRRAAGDLSSLN